MNNRGWQRTFDDPILLPDGRKLITLHNAATFSTKLPEREHDAPEWQAAIEALMLVVDLGGPTMMARIGVMRALYPGEMEPMSRKKRVKKVSFCSRLAANVLVGAIFLLRFHDPAPVEPTNGVFHHRGSGSTLAEPARVAPKQSHHNAGRS